jgi:hypothetical protein
MTQAQPPVESLARQRTPAYHAPLTPATETLPLLLALGKLGGYRPSLAGRLGCSSPETLGLLAGSGGLACSRY